jgi:hypothetical protein
VPVYRKRKRRSAVSSRKKAAPTTVRRATQNVDRTTHCLLNGELSDWAMILWCGTISSSKH